MVAKKSTAPATGGKVEVTPAGTLAVAADERFVGAAEPNDGKPGPKSALDGGVGSQKEFDDAKAKGMDYDVQCHSDLEVGGLKRGLSVLRFNAVSGDEAALKAREAHKANYSLSIRGVTPASDPDPNSLGGEREASIMIANANNNGHLINTLGTDANAEATTKLAKADIQDLGE